MLAGMGTEIQLSVFSSLQRKNGRPSAALFETPENRSAPQSIHLEILHLRQMEKSRANQQLQGLENVKESLRKTMLEQEKIFRNQVVELHRLYRVQKIMMKDQKRKDAISGTSSSEECDLDLSLRLGVGPDGGKKKSRSGSRSESKLGSCPESSSNSTSYVAAFNKSESNP